MTKNVNNAKSRRKPRKKPKKPRKPSENLKRSLGNDRIPHLLPLMIRTATILIALEETRSLTTIVKWCQRSVRGPDLETKQSILINPEVITRPTIISIAIIKLTEMMTREEGLGAEIIKITMTITIGGGDLRVETDEGGEASRAVVAAHPLPHCTLIDYN